MYANETTLVILHLLFSESCIAVLPHMPPASIEKTLVLGESTHKNAYVSENNGEGYAI